MLYNVRVKTYSDGHKQYLWAEKPFFYLDECRDSPLLVERVKRKRKLAAEKRKVKKLQQAACSDEVDENTPYRCKMTLTQAVQRVYDIARSNTFEWFITLTLNPEYVDRYDYDECSKIIKLYTDRLRKAGCKWVIVPEQHEDGAYHFHGLLVGPLKLTYSGKMWYNEVECRLQPVYNIGNYEFGWTTATEIIHPERCATYVTKYLVKKIAVPKGRKSYWASKSLVRPEVTKLAAFTDTYVFDPDMPGGYRIVREHDRDWIFGVPAGVRYTKEIENEHGRYVISEE